MSEAAVVLREPEPDCERFLAAALTGYVPPRPARVEYRIEMGIAHSILTRLLGRTWVDARVDDRASQSAYWTNMGELWYRLGYDCLRLEVDCRLPYHMARPPRRPDHFIGREQCVIEPGEGLIRSWDDFRQYPWPTVREADLYAVEHLSRTLPEGMGILVGLEGGVLEHLVGLLGFEGLCLRLYDQPGLVDAVAERIGDIMVGYVERVMTIDRVAGLFQGDELGFQGSTFLGPEHLRRIVLPWHHRFAEIAHEHRCPYLLHTFGQIEPIMPDLLECVGIDARHGFEGQAACIEDAKRRWGARMGVLGGVRCSVLLEGTPDDVRAETRRILDACRPGGGFAIGAGLSITDDIPLANYLAMIEEAQK